MYDLGYIRCGSIEELAQVVAVLVREGVTFKACTISLKIRLTGGY